MKVIEWARLPGDIIFAAIGVVPLVIAAGLTYLGMKKPKGDQKYAFKSDPNV
jgi:nitric oxide reductase subunit B